MYAEALTVTNNLLDLISQLPLPSFMPNSDASTEAVNPFHSTPVPDLSEPIDKAPSKAATAEASQASRLSINEKVVGGVP